MVAETKNNLIKLDVNNIKKLLLKETEYVKNLLSILPIPQSALPEKIDEEPNILPVRGNLPNHNKKTRAQSILELQERLKSVQSKKKLNYKEKLLEKGLKNRLKKKTKKEGRNLKQKLVRTENVKGAGIKQESSIDENNVTKNTKPIFNKDGKMVFSKFDFSGLGTQKNDRRVEKDPKKILKNLEMQKAKYAELEQKGEKEKAIELKQKHAWKNALAKSEGIKIKDDPILLKKTIKKKDQQRIGSSKKWQVRLDGVSKAKDMRQQKRTENIEKRKKDKKNTKLKKAAKRGRIIPGF